MLSITKGEQGELRMLSITKVEQVGVEQVEVLIFG